MHHRNADKTLHANDALPTAKPAPTREEGRSVKQTPLDQQTPSVLGNGISNLEKVGPYRIGHQISSSASSCVFAATSLTNGHSVNLKLPNGWGEANMEAAKREFRALQGLRHPGVAKSIQLIDLGNRYAVVTERLQRRSVIHLVRGKTPVGSLPNLKYLAEVFSKILTSLHHIHSSGWVHGAIRADHVLFNDSNDPVLIDFSNANSFARPSWCPPAKGLVASSPYLAPELICEAPSNPASDMFAVGRLLACLLNGGMPRWFPGEAMLVSDERLRSQLPSNTPLHLVELCSKLVRMSPVQRPTAAMAFETLNGHRCAAAVTESPSFPSITESAKSSHCLGLSDDAARAFAKASTGAGTVKLITANADQAEDIYTLFDKAPCNDARLVLTGNCDRAEQIPLSGFDSLLGLLTQWFEQLTPTLRESWKQRKYPAIHHAAPALSRALGHADTNCQSPNKAELNKAAENIVRLLTDLAQERTLVLILKQVEQMDAASGRLLCELATHTFNSPIIIVAAISSPAELARNPHVAPLISLANK